MNRWQQRLRRSLSDPEFRAGYEEAWRARLRPEAATLPGPVLHLLFGLIVLAPEALGDDPFYSEIGYRARAVEDLQHQAEVYLFGPLAVPPVLDAAEEDEEPPHES